MGKHASHRGLGRWLLTFAALLVVGALVGALGVVLRNRVADGGEGTAGSAAMSASSCAQELRVVTAESFLPVLSALAPGLARSDNCVQLILEAVDGRAAVARVARPGVDLWIPDDAGWAAAAGDRVAPASTVGSGTTVASSPIYMVTDRTTADRVTRAGATWLGLANMAASAQVRLAVRDPAGSGDGMVGAGAVAEAVWIDKGMDASALALSQAKRVTRTVGGASPALPARPGEVGLVPEYALLPALAADAEFAVLAGRDHTPLLRYTWLPIAAAVNDPPRADAMGRLLDALTGPSGIEALRAAGLRQPDAASPPRESAGYLPSLAGKPLRKLGPHHVDHVFAVWYAEDRRINLLMVVDVSGSMRNPAPGSRTPLINVVRSGCRSVGELLPNDARLGLWEFGSRLDGTRDHRVLLRSDALGTAHRRAWTRTVGDLAVRSTGTGLYDTILAAYLAARDGYRNGMPNQVLIFTDGLNEYDAGSLTAEQLSAQLRRARNPERPIQLSVVSLGQQQQQQAQTLERVLKPIDGYVAPISTAAEVSAAFLHQAAGGVHAG